MLLPEDGQKKTLGGTPTTTFSTLLQNVVKVVEISHAHLPAGSHRAFAPAVSTLSPMAQATASAPR